LSFNIGIAEEAQNGQKSNLQQIENKEF